MAEGNLSQKKTKIAEKRPAIGRSYDAAKAVCDPDFFKASLGLSWRLLV